MSARYLGYSFDIHGGGMDLTFPHHENELAQSCAACSEAHISYWVHNGFVTIDEVKMSTKLYISELTFHHWREKKLEDEDVLTYN